MKPRPSLLQLFLRLYLLQLLRIRDTQNVIVDKVGVHLGQGESWEPQGVHVRPHRVALLVVSSEGPLRDAQPAANEARVFPVGAPVEMLLPMPRRGGISIDQVPEPMVQFAEGFL